MLRCREGGGRDTVNTREGKREWEREKAGQSNLPFQWHLLFFSRCYSCLWGLLFTPSGTSIHVSVFGLIPSPGGWKRSLWDLLRSQSQDVNWLLEDWPGSCQYTCDMADVFWYVWVDFRLPLESCSSAEISRAAQPGQPSANAGSARAIRHRNGPPLTLHSALSAKIMVHPLEINIVNAASWNKE